MSTEIFGVPITVLAIPELPIAAPALILQYKNQCVILYKLTDPLSVQLAILHELAHLCLGHLDGVDSDLEAVVLGETYFTDQQEQAAQKLACRFLAALTNLQALSPPNSDVGARFEELIG